MSTLKLLIGGDIGVFNQGEISSFLEKSPCSNEVMIIREAHDYFIGNLEAPLIDVSSNPIDKCGPNLFMNPLVFHHFAQSCRLTAVTLANNHIRDFGDYGIVTTTRYLKDYGVKFFGLDDSINKYSDPIIFDKEGLSVAIFGYSEHEFSTATSSSMGAHGLNFLNCLSEIEKYAKLVNYVVVLLHGGIEKYEYPTPDLQYLARKMISSGASYVLCQHSHIVGTYEDYLKGTIVYGQGNMYFDYEENTIARTGLLISIILSPTGSRHEFIPIERNTGVLCVNGTSDTILNEFETRSKKITETDYIVSRFREYVISNGAHRMYQLFGFSRGFRYIDKVLRGFFLKRRISRNAYCIRNMIECESHREVILEYIRSRTDEDA